MLFLVKNILMTKIGGEKKSINSIFPGFPPEYILWSHSFHMDTFASLLFFTCLFAALFHGPP